METVLLGFGIREIPASKPQRLARLEKHLLQTQADGKIAALIVDEAHKLNTDALEEIRLLGNLEKRSEKLLQIILAGQNELAATMNREDCVQLKQRVSLRVALRPLAPLYRLPVGPGGRPPARTVYAGGLGFDSACLPRHSPAHQRGLR